MKKPHFAFACAVLAAFLLAGCDGITNPFEKQESGRYLVSEQTVYQHGEQSAKARYKYDEQGNVTWCELTGDSFDGLACGEYSYSNTYGDGGALTRVIRTDETDKTTAVMEYTYDGGTLSRIDCYDSVSDAESGYTDYRYDAQGRLDTRTVYCGGAVTYTYTYGGDGNLARLSWFSDGAEHFTAYEYGADGRIESTKDENGTVTLYEYDENGNVSLTYEQENSTNYTTYEYTCVG